MKIALGVLLILAAIAIGVYVGLYLMFVGGILAIIAGVQADPVNASQIVWGAVRIIFAGTAGVIAFWVLALPGIGLLD